MTKNLQIIKQLQSKFKVFNYTINFNSEITKIDLSHKKIETKDLKLIGELTKLKELKLNNNNITEIKDLDKLTKLEKLDFTNNQIVEIQGLENLLA